MFKKILIANRGEIALRIIRACKELGIQAVAVYSEADENSLHVRFADDEWCIGPGPAKLSYNKWQNIISTAEIKGIDAIHPGYGFLSEDPDFAQICADCKIKFIGPSPEAMKLAGDKFAAKGAARKAGVPVVPGNTDPIKDLDQAVSVARSIGYPVLLKAAAGGGGRGLRLASSEQGLKDLFPIAQAEAEAAFGDPGIYLEKFINPARHIEVQILADEYGNIVYLGERECSIQRRYQKLIEEAPSPFVNPKLRERLGRAAIAVAREIKYTNAGTVEFIVDKDGNFYFVEINARIQVEHPVTEMVTGIDIVKEQIRIAAGEKLSISQKDVEIRGHAIECRINAEDPKENFKPASGEIVALNIPGGPGIRIDTHIYQGYVVPPYYDSLLAKLIAYGRDRDEAIARMRRALEEFVIEGIPTTIPFHKAAISDERFIRGDIDTGFVDGLMF